MKNNINKRILAVILVFLMILTLPICSFADSGQDVNGNAGGGGSSGSATGPSRWDYQYGIRVTIVSSKNGKTIVKPIDIVPNKTTALNVKYHFGKVCKTTYLKGYSLKKKNTKSYPYHYFRCPTSVDTKNSKTNAYPKLNLDGKTSKSEIKKFGKEKFINYIAGCCRMHAETLTNGNYKLIVEPVIYFLYKGEKYAATATEMALFDKKTNGGIRKAFLHISHQNLPFSLYLRHSDTALYKTYKKWNGATNKPVGNNSIIKNLGIVIITPWTTPQPEEEHESDTKKYTYRVNTDVITSVRVSGGQSDPDKTTNIKFVITYKDANNNTKTESYYCYNVYYKKGTSQLAWIKWRTPSTEQTVNIKVSAISGTGHPDTEDVVAEIKDLSGNDPPNPVADDTNDSFVYSSHTNKTVYASRSWSVQRPAKHDNWVDRGWVVPHETTKTWTDDKGKVHTETKITYSWHEHWVNEYWWDFNTIDYVANLTNAKMVISPDGKNPTAQNNTIKSGYGINEEVTGTVNGYSPAITYLQNAVTYFPEFNYKEYWRLLELTNRGADAKFEFKPNKYSTYNNRTHFTPIWYPDGNYTPYTWVIDAWTPAGMLSANLTDTVRIKGNLWDDWHIAPKNN